MRFNRQGHGNDKSLFEAHLNVGICLFSGLNVNKLVFCCDHRYKKVTRCNPHMITVVRIGRLFQLSVIGWSKNSL